jgi:hypothetical protein
MYLDTLWLTLKQLQNSKTITDNSAHNCLNRMLKFIEINERT